ncbi:PLP-dependent aminotransferase family protein [Variovorax sp. H27-G14]|uniref:MocR-like pyridoxine biosynthesis transcription factor PdxR n=1 Tax=Variovorax sp. H27-G14 TaxID=3111914 RepID=UPI0038FC95E8
MNTKDRTRGNRRSATDTIGAMQQLQIPIQRGAPAPLTTQISDGLRAAIHDGRLAPGARLPSWRDFAAQLGVARGTVRLAYERLIDEGLIVAAGAAGTRVAQRLPLVPQAAQIAEQNAEQNPEQKAAAMPDDFAAFPRPASVFQLGVPAHDAFPAQVWARTLARALGTSAKQPLAYPDPRGLAALRAQIAANLAIARGLACQPAQVFVTTGYASALALAVRTLGLVGRSGWMEDPGYPVARRALGLLGVQVVPVPVDAEGLDLAAGIARAPHAALAHVTPGQQAPLGVALSPQRRLALLDWAERSGGWIVEDDYLSELQLQGRAALALGAARPDARVLHIGTFSKTLNPSLRIGFLVVPPAEVARFTQATSLLSPAPAPLVQQALADFMRGGHYLRHLRRMKRLYASRRDALIHALNALSATHITAGLAVLLRLPPGVADVPLVQAAQAHDLSPGALSPWYAQPDPQRMGLLLSVTNLHEDRARETCERMMRFIARHG